MLRLSCEIWTSRVWLSNMHGLSYHTVQSLLNNTQSTVETDARSALKMQCAVCNTERVDRCARRLTAKRREKGKRQIENYGSKWT